MEVKWENLSPEERRETLFKRWLSPPVKFANEKAEEAYKARVTRIKDAIQLRKLPDRVPVFPLIGFFPAYYVGLTPYDMMYDYEKLKMAFRKYVLDFEPDAHAGAIGPGPGRFFEILDYKLYAWPGHGVAPEYSYQCIEGEYMKSEEYDDLIQDPTYFFLTKYFPRVFGALQPFSKLPPFTNVLEMYGGFTPVNFIVFGMPDVQAALKALMEAGNEALNWIGHVVSWDREITAAGFPNLFGGGTKAPFDTLGDTLRGTKGIMLDMYKRPDKLKQAMEVFTPLMIRMGASGAKANGNPIVFIPLHKGADGFISNKQFEEFYWPTLKKVMMGLIDEGCVPFLYAEGGYNTRLELIKNDLPKGKTLWGFDQSDMAKAKEMIGDVACIAGNVPSALLSVGTPKEVEKYVKKLIETCGEGGGFIVMNGAVVDKAKPENLKAMIDATKRFGVYK
ncbi:MAG: uroporphyrinogen decarboxylase family protein [Candidatus Bathyarchaeia archaeon]